MLFSNWLASIRDNDSHANVRNKSNIANRSKSHCERSHAICERSHANFKQRIACDLRIANEVEMGLKAPKNMCLLFKTVQVVEKHCNCKFMEQLDVGLCSASLLHYDITWPIWQSKNTYTFGLHVFSCKKLVYKKLELRWQKFLETLVLLRSIKKLFKVKSMDFLANRSLNLYSFAISILSICVFIMTEHLLIPI